MEKAAIHGELKGRLPQSPRHEDGRARDFSQYYVFQPINLGESDPSKYPKRTSRKAATPDIDGEMPYEDRIRMSFIRFDRFEACEKKVSPYDLLNKAARFSVPMRLSDGLIQQCVISFKTTTREKLGRYAQEHVSLIGRSGALCYECRSPSYRDEKYEFVCSKCGLVQEKLKDLDSWKNYEIDRVESELEIESGDAYDVVFEGLRKIEKKCQYERVDCRIDNGKKKVVWHFTHSDFIKTKFRRCRGQFMYGFTHAHCQHKAQNPNEQCKGCRYAVETCLKERESGADYIELFLRYPALFTFALDDIPIPDRPVSAKELSERYRIMRSFGYPSRSHPTIKKWLNENLIIKYRIGRISVMGPDLFVRLTSRYWIDYGSYLDFMFTSVDLMLRKHPVEGAHAIWRLKRFLDVRGFKKSSFRPTEQNLKGILGEKNFNILVKFRILVRFKPIIGREGLYFSPPYFYRQYPEWKRQYEDYKRLIYKLMNSGADHIFH